ncbi:thioredoxin-like protein [Saitoella complicata NRRL Y-17804]|uniref:Phosducin domain-containing protein n=1 Tax=Saitoella complicata (strain BCRC 22490 / CBS 7301 / JCM 7358 / NBRC 10748 / NRRL Y-17804) TaxID=698492 RepID=A0A0E9NI92_SAICN|nr:thioredoxin-like protein [Saitoella complicata NRRL Y-17804]ODQ52146.1 thioredoxin-like protein [Saitoella complicata NRRL Y-17804]GAO49528.1 hypothetical protein G7K_3677-t1 [Saitoella complicata NRRL Y-17804]
MDPNADTEWNDILREKGILPERPPSPTEMLEEALQQSIKEAHDRRLEGLDIDELDDLEDDEDEEIIALYKAQRMAEMRSLQARSNHGTVTPIQKVDFVREVTEASKGENNWVICYLYKDYLPGCKILAPLLSLVARRYPFLKLTSIQSDMCIPNYPDRNTPTLLFYGNGDMRKQLVAWTAKRVEEVEVLLEQVGCLTLEQIRSARRAEGVDAEDEEAEREVGEEKGRGIRKSVRTTVPDETDDDWD